MVKDNVFSVYYLTMIKEGYVVIDMRINLGGRMNVIKKQTILMVLSVFLESNVYYIKNLICK